MRFLDWYLKIAGVSALIGASMEFFMIQTGFYDKVTKPERIPSCIDVRTKLIACNGCSKEAAIDTLEEMPTLFTTKGKHNACGQNTF
ncbi:hypothetical protein MRB53_010773 [Persea americana]|uniref:Uncharacterized protein n=1 Tax=Persea americana TaxID=3435 RepID=A0ACC2LSN7_PERAE|nr:hypothetical protein MRB53_010773 [Persea americana]